MNEPVSVSLLCQYETGAHKLSLLGLAIQDSRPSKENEGSPRLIRMAITKFQAYRSQVQNAQLGFFPTQENSNMGKAKYCKRILQDKIHSSSQILRYDRSIFCLPHRLNFSDIFDLCLHQVSVVCDENQRNCKYTFRNHLSPLFCQLLKNATFFLSALSHLFLGDKFSAW